MTAVKIKAKESTKIEKMIAVMSGKGGVGKSLVTSLLATALQRKGYRVGILDADLACPSITRMLGTPHQLTQNGNGDVKPVLSRSGIKVMSMSLFSEDENAPLVWRGPLLSSAMKQLYSEVEWGELDYLLIDVPPGTADVPLVVLESLPLDGVIIVSTPQLMATKVVKKCINMVRQQQKSIIGVVEDMAYFIAPAGEYFELYGPSSSSALVDLAEAPLLAQIPIDQHLVALADTGRVEEHRAQVCENLVANVLKALASRQ